MGRDVVLVSSAEETAFDGARPTRTASGAAPRPDCGPRHSFVTSGDVDTFRRLGARFLGPEVDDGGGVVVELTVLGCSGSYGAPGGRRVQRLSRARRRRRHLDGLRQRHVRQPAAAHRSRRGLTRGRDHPRPPRPLRRHLRAARAVPLRPRARRAARSTHPRASRSCSGAWSATGATPSTGTRSATATTPRSASIDAAVLAHRPPAAHVSRSRRGTTASAGLHRRHRARVERRSVRRRRRPRALGGDIPARRHPRADPPLGAPGRRAARARRRAHRLDAHPLVADGRPGSLPSRRAPRRSATRVTLAAPHLITADLTGHGRRPQWRCDAHRARAADDLRPIAFTRDFTEMAAGSVLVEFGRTRVLCTASVERPGAAVAARTGQGLGDRGVLDAAGLVTRARRPRGARRASSRAARRRSSG